MPFLFGVNASMKLIALSFSILLGTSAYQGASFAQSTDTQDIVTGPATDLETAIQYYRLNQWVPALLGFQVLADGGDATAQAYMGVMYRRGWGIQADSKEARRWLSASAESGNAWAQHQLGWMYARAEITDERDFASAVKHWKAAAENGRSSAQLDLAVMYWRGEGTPKDIVMAYAWIQLAARNKELSGMVQTNLNGLLSQMSPEQIKAGEELAQGLMVEIKNQPEDG